MANYKVIEVEGIGPVMAGKLNDAGINMTDQLLQACKTKANRKALAEKSGIDEAKILKFANMVDLFRIKGVGSEYAELLEAAGVDTVKELATRKAENLTQKMAEVNESKKLVRRLPVLKMVEDWISQAKALPRMLEY
ncbi:ferredoxin [Porphyromonas gulae]|uniref:Ferredoxin n=1 Tax=Porphyromonas gulae TaxID=111105 RepID=A0A0A2EA84_9PORP|nr:MULTISPECIES: DUF4332 domain-containing protein [Porphyromonas]KGL56200.1 ferredoxin [Porphyromonas sp. COT-052 OH4946]KGN68300.1 ferredoxin [Porphyromonas gulae]KGN74567.1 ferredoxin [Porphyromonas gulae]KGN76172.1 ferredoxin [Porphyromonas gulae]KGN84529.1 ferredoxin [Porphyromonas gulae]